MSTELTTPEMPDSLSLALYQAARSYQDKTARRVSAALAADHGLHLAPAQLGFLSALICGDNSASDIARRLGISRQAAQKQGTELVAQGFLTIAPDPARRNRRLIGFTPEGKALMSACRHILARLDQNLAADAPALHAAIAAMTKADTEADPGA